MDINEFQQRTMRAARPVVVDFWAAWCAPCRLTKPALEKLGREYAGRVDFLPVNADESHEVMAQFRILGIPSVLALREGREAARITGARSEADYRLLFESLASGAVIRISLSPFDRLLRLGAGILLLGIGAVTSSWLLAGAGLLVAFLGVYDRCPVWRALTRMLNPR
jgi:thioredoxin 1